MAAFRDEGCLGLKDEHGHDRQAAMKTEDLDADHVDET